MLAVASMVRDLSEVVVDGSELPWPPCPSATNGTSLSLSLPDLGLGERGSS